MPPITFSNKQSPTAVDAAATEVMGKEVDEENTHTSESVCSSDSTDADTTATTATNATITLTVRHQHPPSCLGGHTTAGDDVGTDNGSTGGSVSSAAATRVHFTRSPTSPMPCGFPEDFTTTPAAATVAALGFPSASSSVAFSESSAQAPQQQPPSPNLGSAKRTPAPPPPIDFCESAAAAAAAAAASGHAGRVFGMCSSSQLHTVSPLPPAPSSSSAATASTTSPPSRAVGLGAVAPPRPPISPSILHAHSEPFHPFSERNESMPPMRAGSFLLDGPASTKGLGSLTSTPGLGFISPCDYVPIDQPIPQQQQHVSPTTKPFALHKDPRAGPDTNGGDGAAASGGGNVGASPAFGQTHTTAAFAPSAQRTMVPMHGGSGGSIGNSSCAYDMHWQDTGAAPYYYSHFTNTAATSSPVMGGGGGGGSVGAAHMTVDDHYGYESCTSVGAGAVTALVTPSRCERTSSGPYSSWSPPTPSRPAEQSLPGYSVLRPPISPGHFPHRPTLHAMGSANYEYGDAIAGGGDCRYTEAVFEDQDMRFSSYVPQDVQCVEHLDDLDQICLSILNEGEMTRRQYQQHRRERQYLADDALRNDEADGKMMIALDLEGRSLGRSGSICIITLATYSTVYIIDVVLLGAEALSSRSALKEVLESDGITKLMFDCRADCDALYFLYGVRLRGVCDLQISSCFALFPLARHLPGMKDVFRALGLFAEEDTDIKNAGRHLFNPESGGSFDRWEERPLTDILLQYCAVDVKYFFVAKMMLWSHLNVGFRLGEARLASVCAGLFVGCSKGNSLRDFDMI